MIEYDDILNHSYWGHRIRLGDGHYTPGTKDPSHWDAIGLPDRIDGKSLLDVGAFNAMHSFEAERRGGQDILATDVWDMTPTGRTWAEISGRRGFEMAREYIDSSVEGKSISIFDISAETVGIFDISLCLGVLFFLDDIPQAVRNLVDVTEELVVIEAVVSSRGLMNGVRGLRADDNEPPTSQDFETMLRTSGCSRVESFRLGEKPTSRYTPRIKWGWISNGPHVVYDDYRLQERRDEIVSDPFVKILFEGDTSYRIHYGERGSFRQGWIAKDEVQLYREGAGGMPKIFVNKLRYRGPGVALEDATEFLSSRTTLGKTERVVFHGYL